MKSSTFQLTATAVLAALVLLFGLTPIGLIPLGFINLTILFIPVIVGTLLLGLESGLILGACFGLASTLSAFGMSMTPPSGLAFQLAQRNPLLAVLMCFIPRLLVPTVTHFTHKLVKRTKLHAVPAMSVAAVAGTVTNTIFYLGLMLLFYIASGIDAAPVLTVIATVAAVAGGTEAAVAAILIPPIVTALGRIPSKRSKD